MSYQGILRYSELYWDVLLHPNTSGNEEFVHGALNFACNCIIRSASSFLIKRVFGSLVAPKIYVKSNV